VTSAQITADQGRTQIVRELHELIAALDRRLPQVERVGEIAIARAAAVLRGEALKRIAALEHEADADAIASWSGPAEAPAYMRRSSPGDTNGASELQARAIVGRTDNEPRVELPTMPSDGD
jgi:hypothetical protein